jgi:hypothetical protein
MAAACVQLMSIQLEPTTDNSSHIAVDYGRNISTRLELSDENITLSAIQYGLQRATRVTTPTCTAAGIFPIPGNCSSYLICVASASSGFVSTVASCPTSENFDPFTDTCSSTYDCSPCIKPGFVCLSNTSFTLCADNGVPVCSCACPTGYYCNPVCAYPCLDSVLYC